MWSRDYAAYIDHGTVDMTGVEPHTIFSCSRGLHPRLARAEVRGKPVILVDQGGIEPPISSMRTMRFTIKPLAHFFAARHLPRTELVLVRGQLSYRPDCRFPIVPKTTKEFPRSKQGQEGVILLRLRLRQQWALIR